MTCRFLAEADRELDDAIAEYERARPALGSEFAAEAAIALQRVLDGPERWPVIADEYGPVRRCMTNRFPYALLYRVTGGGGIEVIAVMHLHRDPNYWRGRRGSES